MSWYPHTTVATIVEQNGRFLMVEEHDAGRVVFNQPAGHLEQGESLFEAARRETLEETGWHVRLSALLGCYHYVAPNNGVTYIRYCFIADATEQESTRELDSEIIACHWLSAEHILHPDFQARSPIVRQVLEDYLGGKSFPLALIHHHQDQL